MAKYITLFNTTEEFVEFKNSQSFIKPNLSLIDEIFVNKFTPDPELNPDGSQKDKWKLIIDCPFNGDNTNYASDIPLTSSGRYVTDVVTQSNQVAVFTQDSDRMFIELNYFSTQDTGRCKIELDFLCYSHSTPNYPNIIDNGKSGNGGIMAQRDESYWHFGITNKGYNVTQTPPFNEQKLQISQNLIPLNTWLHLHMARYENILELSVYNNNVLLDSLYNDNVGIFNASLNPHMGRIAIGGSYTWGSRYLNGCIKNFKLYVLE